MRVLLPLMLAIPMAAAADEFRVAAPVDAVTLYPQGAEVTRGFSVQLPAGRHQVMFALPAQLNISDVDLGGAVTILGQRRDDTVLDPLAYFSGPQRAAWDTLKAAERDLANGEAQIDTARGVAAALEAQITYLQSASAAGSAPASPDAMGATLALMAQELPRLGAERVAQESRIAELEHGMETLEQAVTAAKRAFAATDAPNQDWARYVIEVNAPADTTLTSTLKAYSQEAGWQPSYDIALDTGSGAVTVTRKAVVQKYSPGAWTDVALTLSTVIPSDAVEASPIFPDIVRLFDPVPKAATRSMAVEGAEAMDAPIIEPEVAFAVAEGGYEGAAFVFEFEAAQSLSGGGNPAELSLGTALFDGNTEIIAIPRRDATAFVTARVKNGSGGPLLAGPARVHRDGTYLGDTFLDEIPDRAEVTLPFGALETLRLSYRVEDREEGDRGLITRSNTQVENVAFTAENLGSETVDLTALFALPVSEQEDLEVRTRLSPDADTTDANGVRGVASWDMTLAPGESRDVMIEMTVTWPDGQIINWRP